MKEEKGRCGLIVACLGVAAIIIMVVVTAVILTGPDDPVCPDGRVIVVGAGMAGLSAADTLRRFGCEVVVLEGDIRIGGRTKVIADGPLAGQDLGAHWIHAGNANPILTSLSSIFSLQSLPAASDTTSEASVGELEVFFQNGTAVEESAVENSFDLFDAWIDRARAFWESSTEDSTVEEALQATKQQGLSIRDQLLLDWQQSLSFESDEGDSPSKIGGAAFFNDENRDFYEGDDSGDRVFEGGYASLASALSQSLDLRLSHVVETVVERPDGVGVKTQQQGWINGSVAIMTPSVGCLQRETISFSPQPSQEWQSALQGVGMGRAMKIILGFNETFWDRRSYTFGYISGRDAERGKFPYWVSTDFENHTQLSTPALVCFVGGDMTVEVDSKTDEEIVQEAVNIVQLMFNTSHTPIASHVAKWDEDRFVYGGWSHIRENFSNTVMATLGRPQWGGKLLFAGEHTCRLMLTTVHGAVASGLRAANLAMGNKNGGNDVWSMMQFRNFCEE